MRKVRWRAGARGVGLSVASVCAVAAPLSAAQAAEPICKPISSQTDVLVRALDTARIAYDAPNTERQIDICEVQTAGQTMAIQSGITVVTTIGFTGAIMGRLDAVRGEAAAGGGMATNLASLPADGMMALGARQKSRAGPAGPTSPFTAYVTGSFLGGSSDATGLTGFSYDATSGLAGIEYSVSRNLILGLALGFTTTNANLTTGATIDADAIQAAAYLSYATKQWFVDALAAYGAVGVDMARPTVGDVVRGSTDAGVFALAARGGYLLDFGKLRAGPIAGLTYVHARVDGYTETGVGALTVDTQTVDSLTASAGIRFLAPFQAGGHLVIPYLNVTLEHQFGDGTQQIVVNVPPAPGTPVPLSFPAFDARDYGKIEGGITVELAPEASVSVSGASTFARDEAQDFRISAGLNYRF